MVEWCSRTLWEKVGRAAVGWKCQWFLQSVYLILLWRLKGDDNNRKPQKPKEILEDHQIFACLQSLPPSTLFDGVKVLKMRASNEKWFWCYFYFLWFSTQFYNFNWILLAQVRWSSSSWSWQLKLSLDYCVKCLTQRFIATLMILSYTAHRPLLLRPSSIKYKNNFVIYNLF